MNTTRKDWGEATDEERKAPLWDLVTTDDDELTAIRCQAEDEASYDDNPDREYLQAQYESCMSEATRKAYVATSRDQQMEAVYLYGYAQGYSNLLDFGYAYFHN